MIRSVAFAVALWLAAAPLPAFAAQPAGCAAFDAYEWAQSVYDADPAGNAALDPDGDGIACPELPNGAAPALFADGVPDAAEPARVLRVVDGDTIEVEVGGAVEDVRLILVDTPESKRPGTPVECYAAEATAFAEFLFFLPSDGTVYLQRDVSERDRYGRLLRYAWLDLGGGEVYLANEAITRSGFGALSTYPPDVRYADEIREAQTFARRYGLGLWSICGGNHEPLPVAGADGGDVGASVGEEAPAPAEPAVGAAPPAVAPAAPAAGCDPSYPDACIPPSPPDLDCGDVGARRFAVVPPDPHGFDGDGDGVGCER